MKTLPLLALVLCFAVPGSAQNSCQAGFHLACVPDAVPVSPLTQRADCGPNEALAYPNDGPATLPQRCVYLAPLPTGGVIHVATAAALQTALVSANCGKIIALAAGVVFGNGNTTFTGPDCTAGNWIQIRSDASDSAFPPSGTRINPSYAGVSSLPGRPAFSGGSSNVMAKFLFANSAKLAPGNFTRLGPGLEITMPSGTVASSVLSYQMVDTAGHNHIIVDRDWIHGTAIDEAQRGVSMSGGDHIAVIDSYLNDFHCRAPGKCSDSQGISGGIGNSGAAFLVDNNFVESAAEGLLFGGGGSPNSPGDLIVRRTHFFKPLIWMPGSTGFVGVTFYAKNDFELKNCQRCLLEGVILENAWGGFSQSGFSLVLTPKNQNCGAPAAQVSDTTIRYSELRGSGAGIQQAAAKSAPGNCSSLGMWNVSLHDLKIGPIDNQLYYKSSGTGWQLTQQDTGAKMDNIAIRNITFTGGGHQNSAFMFGSSKAGNVTIKDSIFFPGTYDANSTGAGTSDCSYGLIRQGAKALAACWTSATFTGNIIPGGNANWPTGTLVPTTSPFVSPTDYHVLPVYLGKGADIDGISQAIAGAN